MGVSLSMGYFRASHTHGTCVQFGNHCVPADRRDCNGVLNCPWYHGCSESKHGFVAACRCVFSYDCCSCGAAAWVVLLSHCLPTLGGGVGVGECSMLAQCELRHTAGVELHAVGMLHSFGCCGRRCSAAAEELADLSTESIRRMVPSKVRRIRLVQHSSVCLA